jgi:uncharacterized protein YukE
VNRPTDWYVLDLARDPTPGDPHDIASLARRVQHVSDDAGAAQRDVRALAGDGAVTAWIGLAADVFRGALDDFPGQLGKLADSYGRCSSALAGFGSSLSAAQDQADRALAAGRVARADIESLQGQLSAARGAASSASASADALTRPVAGAAPPPDPDQVRAATRNVQAASARVSSLSGALGSAQSRLELAKRLARQAEDLRNDAGDRARADIHDASDAGISPNSFWEDFKSGAAKVWDVTITVAKIAVAVLGIVVLIIGGPLAWIVVGLSVLILADALRKVASGAGSWLDVAVAALGLIPGTKGLTSLGAVRTAFSEGRLLGVAAHLGGEAGSLFANGARGARSLWQGRALLPIMLKQAPGAAGARVLAMAAEVRGGAPGALRGFGIGFADGTGLVGRARGAASGTATGFRDARATFLSTTPAGAVAGARRFQGSVPYLGVDRWTGGALSGGTRFEAGYPGVGGFVVPDGSLAALGGDSRAFNEGVQVGSYRGGYRDSGISYRANVDLPVANSHALANPQFGGGGHAQHYVPDFASRLRNGDITVVDSSGALLPARPGASGSVEVQLPGSTMWTSLSGTGAPPGVLAPLHDTVPGAGVYRPEEVRQVVDDVRHVRDAVTRPFGLVSRIGKLVP